MTCEFCNSKAADEFHCPDCGFEIIDERDAFARMVAASNVSNADFHAALEQYDAQAGQQV